jgi:uncharacterized protein YodC (DUF2158 family)
MDFKTGDIVQPKSGGQKMTVRSVDGDSVECTWGTIGEEKTRAFSAQELSPYHEDGDFGVC